MFQDYEKREVSFPSIQGLVMAAVTDMEPGLYSLSIMCVCVWLHVYAW